MIQIREKRLPTELLDSHHYVCDLLRAEFPALSLYTDGRQNWMYLWVDTDSVDRHRFILFTVSRESLNYYLKGDVPLRAIFESSDKRWVLDEIRSHIRVVARSRSSKEKERIIRHLWCLTDLAAVSDYVPTADSKFDPSMAPDIDLTKQLLPTVYEVPIKGEWFGRDFEYLFKRYERIYAFFYATQPRFVRTINTTLHRLLRAPWKGGFSRVNLYSRLAEVLPGQHALRVAQLNYASPGDVHFEAIQSIGESIQKTTVRYLEHEDKLDHYSKKISKILSTARLNKVDLSTWPESSIRLNEEQKSELFQSIRRIAKTLDVEHEITMLAHHSPNSVVHAKAVVSFVRQVRKLSILQRQGILDYPVE